MAPVGECKGRIDFIEFMTLESTSLCVLEEVPALDTTSYRVGDFFGVSLQVQLDNDCLPLIIEGESRQSVRAGLIHLVGSDTGGQQPGSGVAHQPLTAPTHGQNQ